MEDDSDEETSITEETAAVALVAVENQRFPRQFVPSSNVSTRNSNSNPMDQFYSNDTMMMDHGTDHDQLEHRPVGRKMTGYRKQIAFLMFLIALQHYMPPPPPPCDTWADYISHSTEGFKATLTNFGTLTWYIVSGCFNNMQRDGKLKFHAMLLSEKEGNVNLRCPILLALPKSSDSFDVLDAIQTRIKDKILGQDSAIEAISRALTMWDSGDTKRGTIIDTDTVKDNDNDNFDYDETESGARRPLNMLFTGSHGVGKHEVAKLVAEIMINTCRIESFRDHISCAIPECNRDNSDGILDLSGIEYALDGEDNERALIQRILDHIHTWGGRDSRGAGAIIILRHVENLSMGAKLELVRLLSKQNVIFTPAKTMEDDKIGSFGSMFGMKNDFRNGKKVDIRLDNSLFIMTTDLGADKIFSGLRNHVIQARVLHDTVQVEVEQDVKRHFGVKVSSERCWYSQSYLRKCSLINRTSCECDCDCALVADI